MSLDRKPVAASALSFLSGIFVILGTAICSFGWDPNRPMSWMEGIIHGWEDNMARWNIDTFAFAVTLLGIVFGAVIIVSAITLYKYPERHQVWGTWVVSLSIISILTSMGGLGIGLILGIIGGILAILWEPKRHQNKS